MGLVRGLQEGQKEKRSEFTQIDRRPFRIDRIDLWRLVEKQSELKPRRPAMTSRSFRPGTIPTRRSRGSRCGAGASR